MAIVHLCGWWCLNPIFDVNLASWQVGLKAIKSLCSMSGIALKHLRMLSHLEWPVASGRAVHT